MSNGRSGQPAAVAVKEREKDEDDILALVQANVVDQSAYEETVLRQATLATAPRLEITSSSSSATAGRFPMDDGVAAFEPHVILARIAETRRHLSVDPDNDRLHMKLQLLLQWSNHNRKPKNNKSGSAGRGQPPLSKKKKEEADTTTTTKAASPRDRTVETFARRQHHYQTTSGGILVQPSDNNGAPAEARADDETKVRQSNGGRRR
jgi:hypothetical protein